MSFVIDHLLTNFMSLRFQLQQHFIVTTWFILTDSFWLIAAHFQASYNRSCYIFKSFSLLTKWRSKISCRYYITLKYLEFSDYVVLHHMGCFIHSRWYRVMGFDAVQSYTQCISISWKSNSKLILHCRLQVIAICG